MANALLESGASQPHDDVPQRLPDDVLGVAGAQLGTEQQSHLVEQRLRLLVERDVQRGLAWRRNERQTRRPRGNMIRRMFGSGQRSMIRRMFRKRSAEHDPDHVRRRE